MKLLKFGLAAARSSFRGIKVRFHSIHRIHPVFSCRRTLIAGGRGAGGPTFSVSSCDPSVRLSARSPGQVPHHLWPLQQQVTNKNTSSQNNRRCRNGTRENFHAADNRDNTENKSHPFIDDLPTRSVWLTLPCSHRPNSLRRLHSHLLPHLPHHSPPLSHIQPLLPVL